MPSVLVTGCTFNRSGAVISAQVTYETTFNDSEVRNNIGFIATLSVTASIGCTSKVPAWPGSNQNGSPPAALDKFRNSPGRQLAKVVRPGGSVKVVTTDTATVNVPELFYSYGDLFYTMTDAALDAHIDLAPEIAASRSVVTDQLITS